MTAQVRFAGFWLRLLAHLIDSVVLLELISWLFQLMLVGAWYWIKVLFHLGGEGIAFWDSMNSLAAQIVNAVIYSGFALAYFGWGQYRYGGTTLGKRLFRIRVVNAADLGPMTLKQSMIRCFSYLLSYLPLGTGFLMAAFNPHKRALHDLVAGTVSIITEKKPAEAAS